VLKISSSAGSALITGDIERRGERTLLALQAAALASDLLVAPHHGSNSSSSAPFVAAVAPKLVLFPVGYRNRWGFPKSEVLERYRDEGAVLADTVQDGAIRVRFRAGEKPAMVMRWRRDVARLWTER
jgi:competence protein ComEC